jgi:hypothetical protein
MRRRRAWHLSAIAGTAAASLVRRGPVRGQLRRQPWTPSRQSGRPRAARGPVTRVLLKPGAPGCWGPLSWASESSFVTVLRPCLTGPARPGSLARCGEHATAAGPGSVIQVAFKLDQPQAGPRPLRLRSCDGTPLAPLRLQVAPLRAAQVACAAVHVGLRTFSVVRRAAALACPSTSRHWQHDLCLMPWWHSGSGS